MLSILALVSGSALISAFISLVCVGLVFWLLWWLIQYIAPPEPFLKIGKCILTIMAVIFLIGLIAQIAGHPFVSW
jgi:hypothetical protein